MARYIEDEDNAQEVQISNAMDWVKFNTPTVEISNDPFKIEGEDLQKVGGLSPTFVVK